MPVVRAAPVVQALAVACAVACTPQSLPRLAAPTQDRPAEPGPSATAGLIVHEWGTFTSMQDPSGNALGGMHHDDAPLPGFVYRRNWSLAVSPEQPTGEEPTQRMETPVLYLYAQEKTRVSVRVEFPTGLMTEWFPDCAASRPAAQALEHVAGGGLTWEVEVDPALDRGQAPAVATDSIWLPSRQVAAPALRTVPGHGTQRKAGAPEEVEAFLFYRGVGRFDTPITVEARPSGTLQVRNHAPETVAAAFLLHVPDATGAAIVPLGALPGRGALVRAVPTAHLPMAAYLAQARETIAAALVSSGLYPDEAWALVNTWSHSYFQTPGLRVLYLLPQPWTDALLPLTVTPQPAHVVRTLVGRIEVLTPAMAAATEAAIRSSHGQLPAGHAASADAVLAARSQLVADLQPYAEARLIEACPRLQGPLRQHCEGARDLAHRGW